MNEMRTQAVEKLVRQLLTVHAAETNPAINTLDHKPSAVDRLPADASTVSDNSYTR